MGVDARQSGTKSDWNGAKFSPSNQKEDDAQPNETEWEYIVSQHQGMPKKGEVASERDTYCPCRSC